MDEDSLVDELERLAEKFYLFVAREELLKESTPKEDHDDAHQTEGNYSAKLLPTRTS
jgi:hypothetical protein